MVTDLYIKYGKYHQFSVSVFRYCNKTPETTCRIKNTCVTSLFLSFQAVISWLCCFGPTARQQCMVGAGGRTNPPSSQPGNRKEWREGPGSPSALQGNPFYDPKIPSWDPTCLQVPLPPTALGPKPLPHGPSRRTQHPAGVRQSANQLQFFCQQQTSVWKSIHQNCNTCQVCQYNGVERMHTENTTVIEQRVQPADPLSTQTCAQDTRGFG